MLVLLIQLLHCFQIQPIVLEDDHILGCQISLQQQMQADVLLQRCRNINGIATMKWHLPTHCYTDMRCAAAFAKAMLIVRAL